MTLLSAILLILLVGSMVYCLVVTAGVWSYWRDSFKYKAGQGPETAISILKPLAGAERDLERNLRSFFEQDYGNFELLFAVRSANDPAVPIVEQVRRKYPHIPSRLLVTGEPPYANAKVYSLSLMTQAAAHDVLVMSDSDIYVNRSFLTRVAREVSSNAYDLASCPYRAAGGGGIWSRLEALGMNTEFWGGVFAARLLEGVKFTVGPTTVAHRRVLQAISWDSLSRYLAEDFVLGQRSAAAGFRVALSHCVVEHRLAAEPVIANLSHRLRWARSTRRSRPAGYVGQAFTYPVAWAMLLGCLQHSYFARLMAATLLIRLIAAAASTSRYALAESLSVLDWLLVPLQDLLGFAVWIAGFSGNRIRWRGRKYFLNSDGTFDPVA